MKECRIFVKAVGMAAVRLCRREVVFSIAFALAVLSSFLVPPSADYLTYPDYRVLALLFCLMLIVAGLKKQGVFHLMGRKLTGCVKKSRQLELVLIFLCFFFSMFITNDVALITFVPFTLELMHAIGLEKKIIKTVVLQTIAANLGSMLTPIGNPQNLYLYTLTGVAIGDFLIWMLPLTGAALLLLIGAVFVGADEVIEVTVQEKEQQPDMKKLMLLSALFLICMGTVSRVIPWQISFAIVLLTGLCFFRYLFKEVDYFLLGTFLGFFIFIGNMQNIPKISAWIEQLLQGRELWVATISSQIISNVPAAMLLSGFSDDYRALLYGVDVGGLGTLIASLASLISYKFYARSENAGKGRYMLAFTAWNLMFMAVLLPMAYWLLHF